MSSSANPQHEPTMEEILASIRKIISEDQTEPEKSATAPSAAAPEAAASAAAPQVEADVLELTEEVHEEISAPPVPEPVPPIENDIAFESVEAESKEPPMDDLISDTTRSAMDRAFAHLDRGGKELAGPAAAAGGGTLDSLFLRAIQDAFTPTLLEWVDSHHAEILDEMKPLIRDWMDDNLPSLIEAAVTKEIARSAAAIRPRKR
jgi:cell pole-organizing protein PopZ